MSKSDVAMGVALVTYVLGVFLTWTYLIAYSWTVWGENETIFTALFGWLPGIFWPLIVTSLAWVHFWFV